MGNGSFTGRNCISISRGGRHETKKNFRDFEPVFINYRCFFDCYISDKCSDNGGCTDDSYGRIRWAEPVRMSRILPALAQCLLTAWLGYHMPTADGAGDILAVFGLVWAIWVNIGTAVLVWLLSGIDRLFLRGDDV